jgi:hypothetical protein
MSTIVFESYWDLRFLRDYYESIRNNYSSDLGKILATWESLKYFESFSQSMKSARDQKNGSQDKINFQNLVSNLRKTLARDTFKEIFKNAHQKLLKSWIFWKRPMNTPAIQREAIKTLISLCQIQDPTLACLYADFPERDQYNQSWIKRCVGPESVLCKDLFNDGRTLSTLESWIDDPEVFSYMKSLCNF